MKKKLFYIVSVLLIVLFGIAGLNKYQNKAAEVIVVENVEESIDIELILDYGDDSPLSFPLTVARGETAFSVLEKVTSENDIALDIQQYDFGVFVKKIGEKEGSAEMAWIYFINGQSGQVAADQMELSPKDKVEWKYIEPEM